ncbi:hypothetical protein MXB_4846 [Myxobolus squamalis]|nr:hypothetical protein MXB_4846 [Myxobolus squamalis]
MVVIELKLTHACQFNDEDIFRYFTRFSFRPIIENKNFKTNIVTIRPDGNINLFKIYTELPERCPFGTITTYFENLEQLLLAHEIIEYNESRTRQKK